jgi:hypothetical protein
VLPFLSAENGARKEENAMRKLGMLVALALVATLTAAAAPPLGSSACAQDMTCHEECALKCWQLYPNNPGMRNLCTWSCIDQECGGGPYP